MKLEEFDPAREAVINPWDIVRPRADMPKTAVSCFSHVLFERMIGGLDAEEVTRLGKADHDVSVYKASYNGVPLAFFDCPVGAPAALGVCEEVFQLGAERIIVFGTCGVLDASIEDCGVIIPTSAVRDEGASFHYAPPSDEIEANPRYKEEFIKILESRGVSYTLGKVWTTDGIYRETREKAARRKREGCVAVDMECSALMALAQFRGKDIFSFFYAADNLDAEKWDARSLSNSARLEAKDRVALLALELAKTISE